MSSRPRGRFERFSSEHPKPGLSGQHDDKLLFKASRSIETAVKKALSEGEVTKDLGGNLDTKEFTETIIEKL